jgi:gamma-glutamyltranspeptidase/glutathione hydrolase
MFKAISWILLVAFTASCSPKYASYRYADVVKHRKRSDYEAYGKKYMISTQGTATTKAAKYVLDKGGNIFDAAAAASFAISVERPHSTGIGGGGFMVIHHANSSNVEAVDFREMAPRKAYKKMYLDANGKQVRDKSLTGSYAVGTPGLVAGVVEVHKKYGKLPLATVLEPAIKLAEEGFPVYPALHVAMQAEAKRLCQFEAARKIFLTPDCKALPAGTLLKQTDLGKTLRAIAENGRNGFYRGYVADQIVKYQKETKGLIRHNDLKYYKVKNRKPVEGTFRGHRIVSMPSPSSGGTHVIEILNILEGFNLKEMGPQSAQAIHLTSAAMQIAFADRAAYMGDSDFANNKKQLNKLITKDYAAAIRQKIHPNKAVSSKEFPVPFNKLPKVSDHTTHFTIMDGAGNVVTSTQTINGWFGSAMVTPGTGIVMNNEMDDFASHVGGVNLFGAVGGKYNLVYPRKRPLSSMSPTIVFDKTNKPMLALGTPSGTRILTCVMQTILNSIEHELPLWEAVAATRYHHQWSPDEIRVGSPHFSKETEDELKAMGYKINHKNLGCKIQVIKRESDGRLHGVSDPREEGMSYGE